MQTPDPKVRVSLASGPPGATIQGNQFNWIPRREDVGLQKIVLRAEFGKCFKERVFPCFVGNYDISLPLTPHQIRFSPDGTKAAVWSWDHETYFVEPQRERPQIAVLDIRKQEVLAYRPLRRPIADVVLDSQQVYVLESDGSALEVSNLVDLAPRQTLTLTQPMFHAELLNERLLLLASERERTPQEQELLGGTLLLVDVPAMTESPLTKFLRPVDPKSRVFRIGKNWVVGSAVLDEELKSTRYFVSLDWSGAVRLSEEIGDRWYGTEASRDGGQPPANLLTLGDSTILLEATRIFENNAVKGFMKQLNLKVTDQGGSAARTFPWTVYSSQDMEEQAVLQLSGQELTVVTAGHLFRLPLDAVGVKPVPPQTTPTLTLRPEKAQLELSPNKKTTIRVIADHGKPPYQFVCTGHVPDKAIEKGSQPGTFVIDGKLLSEGPVSGMNWSEIVSELMRRYSVSSPKEMCAAYQEDVRRNLQSYVGSLRDFPIIVSLQVVLGDSAW